MLEVLVSQADRRTEKRSEVGMTNQEAIETIEANYPPKNYSMLREALDMAMVLLKEQEEVTEYVIDEFQPTCKVCGFRPFVGFIPSLEWMRERGFNCCPHCRRKVKWK